VTATDRTTADDATFEAALRGWEGREAVDAAEDARVEAVADWLCKEYGELLNGDADGPPGYWEFQARELLAALPSAPQMDAHEFQCPACGATTRARMADAPQVDTAGAVERVQLEALSHGSLMDDVSARAALGESR
jgi:hypothetical protein